MCTKSQLEAIEEEMVNYYRSVYGDSIDTIILYGSYARGDYSDDSDIDITAIVRGNRVELQKKLKKRREEKLDDLVSYRIENAREKLESSKILLDAGHYKDSIGRLFYFYRSSCGSCERWD